MKLLNLSLIIVMVTSAVANMPAEATQQEIQNVTAQPHNKHLSKKMRLPLIGVGCLGTFFFYKKLKYLNDLNTLVPHFDPSQDPDKVAHSIVSEDCNSSCASRSYSRRNFKTDKEQNKMSTNQKLFYGISGSATAISIGIICYLYKNRPKTKVVAQGRFERFLLRSISPTNTTSNSTIVNMVNAGFQASKADTARDRHIRMQNALKNYKSRMTGALCILVLSLPGTLHGIYKLCKNITPKTS